MSEEEFCQLTPAAFARIHRQWTQKQLREDLRVARLCHYFIRAITGKAIPLKEFLPVTKRPVRKKFKVVDSAIVLKQLFKVIPTRFRPKTHGG